MSSSFSLIPLNPAFQAMSRRKPYPYVKDADEIPLDGIESTQGESSVAPPKSRIGEIPAGRDTGYRFGRDEAAPVPLNEIPFNGIPMAALQSHADVVSPQASFQRAITPKGFQPSTPDEIPLGNLTTVQPLSKEQELDLTPLPEQDRTREAYQSLYNAGTPKPAMPDHSKEQHGFWGNAWQHLKHAGKGALLGALLGGRAGGAGALGGALLGGLTGGISPRAADTMEYNTITEPKWEHENQRAQEEAARKAGIADHYAQTFGASLVDPNQKTQQAKTQEEVAKDRQERQAALESDRTDKNRIARDRESRMAASQKLNNLRRLWEKGGITDPKDKATFAQLSGVSGALADAYVSGEAAEDTDEQGRMVIVHKRTGKRELVTDPDTGQPVMSFKATQQKDRQRHEKEIESQGRQRVDIARRNSDTYANKSSAEKSQARREAVAAIREHENMKAQAVKYQNDATRLESQANAATKDADREKYQALAEEAKSNAEYYKDRANRRAQDAATDYPDFVEHGTGDNGWDYGKMKPGARTTGSASRSTAANAPSSSPKEVNASQLDELLKRAQAKEPTLTINELRKRLAASKVTINEGK